MPFDATAVIEIFETAKEENELSTLRHGQVITLPDQGEVWMTGDIHDNRTNFNKLITAAALGSNPRRHLVLHELIHGDYTDESGAEDSWKMLHQAAEMKCDFPQQVHFLLANHDLAQIHGEGILKAGRSVCESFDAAIDRDFGPHDGSAVKVAITEFLLSLPLAIRTPGGLLFTHSIPPDDQLDTFDYTVFDRMPLKPADYARRTGPVYQLIWGRRVTPAGVDKFLAKMSEQLGCELETSITGHQPQDTGYAVNGDRHIIIASDHSQGVFLPLDLNTAYNTEELAFHLQKFAGLGVNLDDD
jgi:hypothetical protein